MNVSLSSTSTTPTTNTSESSSSHSSILEDSTTGSSSSTVAEAAAAHAVPDMVSDDRRIPIEAVITTTTTTTTNHHHHVHPRPANLNQNRKKKRSLLHENSIAADEEAPVHVVNRHAAITTSTSGASDSKKKSKHSVSDHDLKERDTEAVELEDLDDDDDGRLEGPADSTNTKLTRMADACRTILECIGEDPNREGLVQTPERWAKALLYFTSGYATTPDQVTNGAVFEENHDEMVVVRNIDIHSLCEHHMVPFTGKVHIGYIPKGKILGLSKLARISELFARRLQVQERLTRQIADAIVEIIDPLGVAVVMECTHLCMVMRGVQKTSAITTTSSVRGCFEQNSKTRAEFFSIIHGGYGMRMG